MSINRLHHKLVIFILSSAIFVAVIATSLSYITEYNHSKRQTEVMLLQLMDTVESTAAIAAYTRDKVIAEDVINGLLRNEIVYKASIISDRGLLAEKKRQVEIQNMTEISRPLFSPFSEKQGIGQLIISPNTQYYLAQARHAAYAHALNSTFLILATTIMLLIVVRSKISLPLEKVSNTLHAISAGKKNRITVLDQHKHDELGRLVNDINNLLSNLEIKFTEEQSLRKSIQEMEQQLRHIYDSSSAGLFLLDINGKLLSHNPTLLKVLRCSHYENETEHTITEKDFASLFINEKDAFLRMLDNALETRQLQAQDFSLQRDFAPPVWIHCVLSKVVDASGKSHIEGVLFDISERVIIEQTNKYNAEHDSLTGLLRKQAINDRFDRYEKQANPPVINLFLLDLDDFKQVNDIHGHAAGDKVLITVANRLRACVRSSDLISRMGGDEFLIVVIDAQSSKTNKLIAEKILQSIQQPINITPDLSVSISVSIGIANTSEHGQDFSKLVKSADDAMYTVKRQGKNGSDD